MMTKMLRHVPMAAAVTVLVAGLGVWLLATPPARAVVDTAHLISGGSNQSEGVTAWTAPGLANTYTTDFPSAGLGESSAQLNMPAGTLSRLRVKVTTAAAPASGSFTLMVRVNGADTTLTCSVAGTGQCNAGNKVKGLLNNSLLAIRTSNTFTGTGGSIGYTYSMLLD